ncbi:Transcription termination factor 2 [Phytophthora ramorum]|uniref:Transcription termination factor 2 n=1 Tax=Phytophthora ramorum TaxID=164328 RepID=UPI0030A688A0|nr:Transcription termination factor 2 [Phytophthora ramorum]
MGRWQREYERDWRDYTQRAIADRFGKYAVQFSPSVTSEDEQLLREVLADVGIAHVAPNHSRWHAPIPASQSLSAASRPHDSIISNGSYVYNTPPSADSQSMFPAFSSQDFGSQTTSQRRVSASQRLQLRMANVSPIADNRRASIEMAGTISPPSGATKSPWSPGAAPWSPKPTGKSRRTPRRSLEPSFRADDLDVSMQSMQLSDDERTRMDDVDVEVEDTQMLDMSEVHEGGNASKGEEIEEQHEHTQIEEKAAEEVVVETQMVDHHDAAEDMNVSKELIFSSDSEEEDEKEQKETAEPEAEMAEEEKPIIEMSGTARSEAGAVPRLTPPTLIVTPLSILSQWEHEIRAKTNLSVVTYQGATRKSFRSATQFMGADIVLSTYDTLRLLECKIRDKDSDGDGEQDNGDGTASGDGWHQAPRLTPQSKRPVVTSKLHQLQWFRVILDESHLIANAGCARARAAFTLSSRRRWCVTGTPIQNRTADLVALLQFAGLGNRAHALSERELGALVPRVVMRRLKSAVDARSRAPILDLPEKTEELIELDFASDVERALYMLLHRSTKRQVLRYLQSKESKQARRVPVTTPANDGDERPLFMHVFELILRLRQVCDATSLVTKDPLAEVQTRAASAEALVGNGWDGISPFSSGEAALLKRLQERRADGNAVSGCGPLESTKLTALMQELKKVRARRERVLVISQWTSFLDVIAEALEAHNSRCEKCVSSFEDASEVGNEVISFAKLDGRMSVKDREQVVRNFQQHEDNLGIGPVVGPPLDVLLLSLRTGGLGLNLTAAAHVFITEPSWNPSLERQAVDRAHRFGQTRNVRVVRFIVKGSIEERVVALQNKKRQLTAAFLGDGDDLSTAKKNRLRETRLSTGDLRRLFFTQQEEQDDQNNASSARRGENAEVSDGSVTCIEISE